MLDEHKACRAAGLERGCYLLDLPLREPESVALDLLLRLGKLITITLELEAQQSAYDRAQLLALVIEGEKITRLGIFAYEQQVEDADGLVAFEP